MHFDLPHLIRSLGYFGVWAIVFAESGLLVGFFLPGDSLLFTAGFLASQPEVTGINIWVIIFGCFICAVLGDNVGYLQVTNMVGDYFVKKIHGCFIKNI
jgi:membrane-associated protein